MSEKLKCQICNYETIYKFNYDRHIESDKHKQQLNNKNYKECQCGKVFQHLSSYHRHINTTCPIKKKKNSNKSKEYLELEVKYLQEKIAHQEEITKKNIEIEKLKKIIQDHNLSDLESKIINLD